VTDGAKAYPVGRQKKKGKGQKEETRLLLTLNMEPGTWNIEPGTIIP
jgi:hypothetical protein